MTSLASSTTRAAPSRPIHDAMDVSIYRQADDVLATDLETEIVLIHAVTGASYRLNASAAVLWRALPATAADCATLLQQNFGIDAALAANDVARSIASFVESGLIVAGTRAE